MQMRPPLSNKSRNLVSVIEGKRKMLFCVSNEDNEAKRYNTIIFSLISSGSYSVFIFTMLCSKMYEIPQNCSISASNSQQRSITVRS